MFYFFALRFEYVNQREFLFLLFIFCLSATVRSFCFLFLLFSHVWNKSSLTTCRDKVTGSKYSENTGKQSRWDDFKSVACSFSLLGRMSFLFLLMSLCLSEVYSHSSILFLQYLNKRAEEQCQERPQLVLIRHMNGWWGGRQATGRRDAETCWSKSFSQNLTWFKRLLLTGIQTAHPQKHEILPGESAAVPSQCHSISADVDDVTSGKMSSWMRTTAKVPREKSDADSDWIYDRRSVTGVCW